MEIASEVAELLRSGVSNAEVTRRTGLHPVKVSDARRALNLPDFRDMTPGYVAPPSHREHGTRAKYVAEKCRCKPCRTANRTAENRRTRLTIYGQWEPFVDAEPVRAHIRYLQSCGMGMRVIAATVGVDRKNIQSIVNGRPERGTGPQKGVRPDRAAAILAIRPSLDQLAAHRVIDGCGTVRRIQALVAMGWPLARLANELDWRRSTLDYVLTASSVTAGNARLVRDVYERLWKVDPLTRGASRGGVTYAKRRAAEARWAPVGAWDDDTIDDPAGFPDWTGRCGTHHGDPAHRADGTPVCGPCLEARAAYRHKLRKRGSSLATAV